jgi:dTDP-4-dehydrorhamnose reductase
MLVTGGSGYLGRWVVRLARSQWEVVATYLRHPLADPHVTARQLDVRRAEAVRDLVAAVRPQVIVHTAAAHAGAEGMLRAVNGAGTRHVAAAAARAGARLIYLSTDVLFDGRRGGYREADAPHPLTAYGRSKAQAEAAVWASGAESLVVRTSLIYGWRPSWDRQTRWVVGDLQAGKRVELFVDEMRCPIWVESLAAALIELAGLDVRGTLHVAGAEALSRYDFGVRLARFHGVDPGAIVPTRSRGSGLRRPLDCTLDSSRARALLETPLPGVGVVLGRARPAV